MWVVAGGVVGGVLTAFRPTSVRACMSCSNISLGLAGVVPDGGVALMSDPEWLG